MDYDASSANSLIGAVIVNYSLTTGLILPNLDPKCVWLTITGPDHELVISLAVNGANALELGEIATSEETPLVTRAVEVQVGGVELELSATGRSCCTLLVLGDEAEGARSGSGW